LLCLTERWSST